MSIGKEIEQGKRFEFGANWSSFLKTISEDHIVECEQSLIKILGKNSLKNLQFLDVGCGSGLFSLAARRLGAMVHSFDYDPKSVACARELKSSYFPNDPDWIIEEASVLDKDYLSALGEFDVVYSWGVLHHTGDMAQALNNVIPPVKSQGLLCIAIYNDQGAVSSFWKRVKKLYCSNVWMRYLVTMLFVPYFFLQSLFIGLILNKNPLQNFKNYKQKRGMSIYHDWIDWLGGYPFEVAKPEEIFHLYQQRGFYLENLITTNRLGCNQFLFRKYG